jgi:hypothetical protein
MPNFKVSGEKMKTLIALLFSFIFVSSASAAIYKWVDKEGVVNFTDDESRVPSAYRSKIEIVKVAKMGPSIPSQTPPGKVAVNTEQGQAGNQAPPIAQTLIREGEFAVKLAEVLKIGQAKGEAEAESMLATVGVAPKNGWIADYPMTPIIFGQVRNAVVAAAASKKLPMGEDEALRAFEGLTTEFGLAIAPGQYAESQPPTNSEYVPPPVINEYYYDEGPPVITYYPPPWDYYYLYGWVPYPFWCSGFFFPGFFILNDFHHHHGYHHHGNHLISNHFIDPTTRASLRVDPTTRTRGTAATRTSGGTGSRGFASSEARKGATSILSRSANGRALSQPGNTGRQYRSSQNPSTGSGRSSSRSFSSPSGRTFSSPSTGGRSSFGGVRSGGYSGNFQGARTGSGGSSSSRSFNSPSGRTFSAPPSGGGSSFGGVPSGGYSGGYHGGGGSGGSHGGGQGGGGGFSGNFQGGGGFGGSGGGGQGGGYGGGHGGGHR